MSDKLPKYVADSGRAESFIAIPPGVITEVVPFNSRRIMLYFQPFNGLTFFSTIRDLITQGGGFQAGIGLFLAMPMIREHHGAVVTSAWFALSGGGDDISIMEVFSNEE